MSEMLEQSRRKVEWENVGAKSEQVGRKMVYNIANDSLQLPMISPMISSMIPLQPPMIPKIHSNHLFKPPMISSSVKGMILMMSISK